MLAALFALSTPVICRRDWRLPQPARRECAKPTARTAGGGHRCGLPLCGGRVEGQACAWWVSGALNAVAHPARWLLVLAEVALAVDLDGHEGAWNGV
jgi:hypothetical protein